MGWIGIASLTGIAALLFVLYLAKKVMRQDPGTPPDGQNLRCGRDHCLHSRRLFCQDGREGRSWEGS